MNIDTGGHTLTQHESLALLARNHVGRIAFSFHDRVDILPINYAYDAGWLYGRTSPGARLTTLGHNQWVAFEVDEVRGPLEWDSVVVRGSFHAIDEGLPRGNRGVFVRAMHLAREVVPEALTADDPVPFRSVLFRIAIGEITGRSWRAAERR